MNRPVYKLIISIAVSVLLLYYVLQYYDLNNAVIAIIAAKSSYLVLALILIITAYLIRGYRWTVWEKELNYFDSFKLTLIGFMGNNLLPARLGEILRAHCTDQKTGDNYGRTAALASIAIERVLDGLILSVIGIVGLMFVSVSRNLHYSLLLISLIFAILTAGLIVGIYFHESIRRLLNKIHQVFPGHLTKFGNEKVNYFLDGLLLIKGGDKFAKAIALTTIIWGIEAFGYYFIANAVSDGVSIKICFVFLAAVNFASLFPLTMGGIGAIEGFATAFLVDAGIVGSQAFAMVIIQHLFQFGFTTIAGAIFYFTGGYYRAPLLHKKQEPGINELENADPHDLVQDVHKEVLELTSKLNIEAERAKNVYLSIVIPGYNEQKRLPKTVLQTITWCSHNNINYELILVDDGSKDDTLALARLFSTQVKDIRYIACPHLGKGATVRMGMLNAVGKYILFMDADGATPLDEIPKLMTAIESGSDIAIGSRVRQHPDDTMVVTSLHRKVIGRTFAVLVNLFAIPGFADTQCGFKMFRCEVVRGVFTRQKLNGFAFDVEILFIANKLGLSIAEVPVNWVNQEGSKVNIVTDSIRMLYDILRIRFMHKNEKWDKVNQFYIIENNQQSTYDM